MLKRSTLREIKESLGRYIAIIAIIALGVGFFAGLRVTKWAMIEAGDAYLNAHDFFDYRLASTIGYDDEGVRTIAELAGVKAAGVISQDFFYAISGSGGDKIMQAYSIANGVNAPALTAGRMPEKGDECLVDAQRFTEADIGKSIVVSEENGEDELEVFRYRSYTIVGICSSPLYLNFERGSTALGAGQITAFGFFPLEAFDIDYYTDIYLVMDEGGYLYSDEYKINARRMEAPVTAAGEAAANARYERIVSDAETELNDAKIELADARAEYEDTKLEVEQEIKDAEQELRDARIELDDGWLEYYDGIETFNTEIADAEQEILDGEQELADGYIELLEGEEEYAGGVLALESGIMKYEDGLSQYESGLSQYNEGLKDYEEAAAELEDARKELLFAESSLDSGAEQYEAGKAGFDALVGAITEQILLLGMPIDSISLLAGLEIGDPTLTAAVDQILTGMAQMGVPDVPADSAALLYAKKTLDESAEKISDGYSSYRSGKRQYEEGKAALKAAKEGLEQTKLRLDSAAIELEDALLEIEDGRQELIDGRIELDDGWIEYHDGVLELEDGKITLAEEREKGEQELADALFDLNDGERQYREGLIELEDGKEEAAREFADAEEKLADAEKTLADAEAELADLEEPEVYVLDRGTNIGYACFENDSSIVEGISQVFPIFFFLVAALVCITTMTRMVEDQRTQIGVLKALGYGSGTIMSKYMFYSGSAAFIGCALGYTLGSYYFPKIIWIAYQTMYEFGEIATVFDPVMALGSFLVCMLGTLGVTYSACRQELREVPAELIRPKSPKAGKRVFLEYFPFLWSRLKFLHKVSIRNLLRYKKRFFMMIIGISGCTALLVTGFGIDDSISNITNFQYSEVVHYDCSVVFADAPSAAERAEFLDNSSEIIDSALFLHESSVDIQSGGKTKPVSLIVSPESLEGYMTLAQEGREIPMPTAGQIVVNNGLARAMKLSVGDSIVLRDSDMRENELIVSGIFDNFIQNYAIISPESYEAGFGECEYKSAYVMAPEGSDYREVAAKLLNIDNVASTYANEEMRSRINTMMESMDYIVMLVVACAGALAFIVLYNLTNINITERIREIATLKVLGFYASETSAYVYRENMMLTALGALSGLALGVALHAFVMSQIVVDMVHFDPRIAPISFVYAFALTFGFSMLVSFFMRFKLNKISMAESLKSIE